MKKSTNLICFKGEVFDMDVVTQMTYLNGVCTMKTISDMMGSGAGIVCTKEEYDNLLQQLQKEGILKFFIV